MDSFDTVSFITMSLSAVFIIAYNILTNLNPTKDMKHELLQITFVVLLQQILLYILIVHVDTSRTLTTRLIIISAIVITTIAYILHEGLLKLDFILSFYFSVITGVATIAVIFSLYPDTYLYWCCILLTINLFLHSIIKLNNANIYE
jgi:hypothetical protein